MHTVRRFLILSITLAVGLSVATVSAHAAEPTAESPDLAKTLGTAIQVMFTKDAAFNEWIWLNALLEDRKKRKNEIERRIFNSEELGAKRTEAHAATRRYVDAIEQNQQFQELDEQRTAIEAEKEEALSKGLDEDEKSAFKARVDAVNKRQFLLIEQTPELRRLRNERQAAWDRFAEAYEEALDDSDAYQKALTEIAQYEQWEQIVERELWQQRRMQLDEALPEKSTKEAEPAPQKAEPTGRPTPNWLRDLHDDE